MTASRRRAGWLSGAITAAVIAMGLGGPVIHGQAHLAAVNCPPPRSSSLTSSDGQPSC
jgi:hypothetical protein